MEIRVSRQKARRYRGEVILVYRFQDDGDELRGVLKELDAASSGWVSKILKATHFRGKPNELSLHPTLGALPCEKVLFVGLGERAKWSMEKMRGTVSKALRFCRGFGIKEAAAPLDRETLGGLEDLDQARAMVEGAILGLYRFREYKTELEKEEEGELKGLTILNQGGRRMSTVERVVEEAKIVCKATCWVRDLVSKPANEMTPAILASVAQEMCQQWGLGCHIVDEIGMKQMGMGALLAVASGSKQPPKLIVLEYDPGVRKGKTVAIIGKGITFDSGGISIKPAQKMDRMKGDMAGGAAVLGIMRAAARLKLPIRIIGLIPATENMPSGTAYRPGDVLRSMSGKTIEIVTTDAEGRLILADAITYSIRRYNPSIIIDLATLTGACVVALGEDVAGIMGNDEELLGELKKAGERTGERVWPLPLWDGYEEQLKSEIADIKNAGGREAGAIQGGIFLKRFVETTPWVHVDIAGPAWVEKEKAYIPKGATGFGVRLILEFLKGWGPL